MIEQLHSNPYILMGVLIWLPVCIWCISMITWVIQGDVDSVFGIGSIMMMLFLAVLSLKPPDVRLTPAIFFSIWGVVLLYPVLKSSLDWRAHAEIDVDMLESLYEKIEENPDNMYTAIRMSEILYGRGIWGHAIALAEKVTKGLPKETFYTEHNMLTNWKASHRDPNIYRPIRCLRCRRMVAPGGYACPKCHSRYLLLSMKAQLLGPTLAVRLIAAWFVGILAVIGIPSALKANIPQWATVGLIILQFIIGAFVLVRAFWVHTLEETT